MTNNQSQISIPWHSRMKVTTRSQGPGIMLPNKFQTKFCLLAIDKLDTSIPIMYYKRETQH